MNLEAIRKRLAKALRLQSYPQPQPISDELLEILDRKRFAMSRRGFLGLSAGAAAAIPFNCRIWFIPKKTPLVNLATVSEQSAVDPILARFIFNTHVQINGERVRILRQSSGRIMLNGSKWIYDRQNDLEGKVE